MDKRLGSCRELNNIKNIRTKAPKKHESYSSDISRCDSDSSLSSESDREERI